MRHFRLRLPILKLLISFVVISCCVLTGAPTAKAKLPDVKNGDPLPSNLFVELSKMVNPAVVNISTTQMPKQLNMRNYPRDPFFDFFAPFMGPVHQQPRQALGTGFIIRKDGLILTNNHVIDGADIIKVQVLGDKGKEDIYEASVVGKDARTDIALLKISAKRDLASVELGSSKVLQVGEWVAAFGNPFGHSHTMTKGIISAVGREIDELNRFPFLQTDASINPGNSGGPLVNVKGQVIGVNSAIDARAQGIGFAIPIDYVKPIIKTLEKGGTIKRGFLGVALADIKDPRVMNYLKLKSAKGALVQQVFPKTPASKSGLKAYDFITKAGKKDITSSGDLMLAISDAQVGQKLKLNFFRNGKKKSVDVTIEEHPNDRNRQKKPTIKTYYGQKAPYDIGFKVANLTPKIRHEFKITHSGNRHPVIIDIKDGSLASRAGLAPGDVILDINKKTVHTTKDVLHALNSKFNVIRVMRGDRALLIYLQG